MDSVEVAAGVELLGGSMVEWHEPYEVRGPPALSMRLGATLGGSEPRAGMELSVQYDVEHRVTLLRGEDRYAYTAGRISPQVGLRWPLVHPARDRLVVPLVGAGLGPVYLVPPPVVPGHPPRRSHWFPAAHVHGGVLIGRGHARTWLDVQVRLGPSEHSFPLCSAGDHCFLTTYDIGGNGIVARAGLAFR